MRSSFFFGALAIFGGCKQASISLDDLDTEALRARCERFTRCGLFAAQDDCEAFFRAPIDPNRQPGLDQGLTHYDGATAKRCYDAIAGQTCDQSAKDGRGLPSDCGKIFTGTLSDGDTCQSDAECVSSRCEIINAQCVPGQCCIGNCGSSTLAEADEACQSTRDCADELFCGMDQLCHPIGAVGATCFLDNQCDFGLRCGGSGFPMTCAMAPDTGGSCPDLVCANLGDACIAGTCMPVGLPLTNTACTSDQQCSEFALCDLTLHLCASLPTLGMPCDAHGCAGDAYCDMTTPSAVCSAPLANKMPCAANADCQSLNCVDGPVFEDCEDQNVCL